VRCCSRSFLFVTLLLLVAPAIGISCELASALCGPESTSANGIEAPPCHGTPDMAMDCCSIESPAEAPPAASLGTVEVQAATIEPGALAPLPLSPATVRPLVAPGLEHTPVPDRHALLSVYQL